MAGSNRRLRYIIEYVANLGPLRRLAALQEQFNKAVHAGSRALQKLGGVVVGVMGKAVKSLSSARFEVAALGATISGVLGSIAVSGIKASAAAEDIRNQFDVSFAQVYDRATQVSARMQKDLQLGEITIKKYLSSTQDLLVGFGYAQEGALGLSEQVTRLALDLASWNNVPFDTAMENMLSGLVGNHEALRGLRIVLTQATLERKAEQLGIKESWNNMTEATKIYLRYKVAVEQSVNAVGDLMRTQNETSNRFRFFNEQLKSTLLYIFPKLTTQVGEIAAKFSNWMMSSEKSFRELGDYVAVLGNYLNKAADAVIKFLSKWEGLNKATKELMLFSSAVAGIAIPLLGIIVIFGGVLSTISLWYGVLLAVALVFQDIYSVMRGGNGYFREFLDYTGLSVEQLISFKDRTIGFSKALFTSVKEAVNLKATLLFLKNLFVGTFDIISKDLIPAFQVLWNVIARSEVVLNTFKAIYLSVKLIGAMIGLIGALFSGNSERINKHLIAIKDNIVNIMGLMIKSSVQLMWAIITELVPKLLTSAVSVVTSLLGVILASITRGIVSAFKIVFSIISTVLQGIFSMVVNTVKKIVALIRLIAQGLRWVFENTVVQAISKVQELVTTLIDKIATFKKYLPDWVLEKVGLTPAEEATPKPGTVIADDSQTKLVGAGSSVVLPPPVMLPTDPRMQAAYPGIGAARGVQNVTFGDISMPIYLPENFKGDPEEFRKIASEEATKVFGQSMMLAFDRNSGEG